MHHRFSTRNPKRPTLIGGAAMTLPQPVPSSDVTIERRLDSLREIAFQVETNGRHRDTGPPETCLCMAA